MLSPRQSRSWSLCVLVVLCAAACKNPGNVEATTTPSKVNVGSNEARSSNAASVAAQLPPLAPCADPAVSRLKVWELQVVGGTQNPANGSVLRKIGDAYELHVEWTLTDANGYGTANAPLDNQGEFTHGAEPRQHAVDISHASGVVLEYAAAGKTYLQIRTGSVPHGGNHFRADLPATGGDVETLTLRFADFRRPGGQTPPAADVLSDVFSFTFVGASTAQLTLRQVRVAGLVPPCN